LEFLHRFPDRRAIVTAYWVCGRGLSNRNKASAANQTSRASQKPRSGWASAHGALR